MIEAIIFDFGNIFVNIDPDKTFDALKKLGLKEWNTDLDALNDLYEKGKIEENDYLKGIQKFVPNASLPEIKKAWNSLVLDFPEERLDFLQILTDKYKLFLLSNADKTHIERFEYLHGESFARDFYSCFEKVYFSFEFGFRKPDISAFQFIMNMHHLNPKKTLFVDDTLQNIEGAEKLGLLTWHLNPATQDVTHLPQLFKSLHA
ncbi:HAD family hydrolase [Flavobacterium sp.]|uniref:HAD family hydrolase n=1 Tax=Flavobacterium sp. TaxID=239 RepID=UPI00352934B5